MRLSLKKLQEEKNLSHDETAVRLRLSRRQFFRLRTSQQKISQLTLQRLEELLEAN